MMTQQTSTSANISGSMKTLALSPKQAEPIVTLPTKESLAIKTPKAVSVDLLSKEPIDYIDKSQNLAANMQPTIQKVIMPVPDKLTSFLGISSKGTSTLSVNLDVVKNPLIIAPQVLSSLSAIMDFIKKAATGCQTDDDKLFNSINVQIAGAKMQNQEGIYNKFSLLITSQAPPNDTGECSPVKEIWTLSIPLEPQKDRKFIEELLNAGLHKDPRSVLELIKCFTESQVADYLQMSHLNRVKEIQEFMIGKKPIDFMADEEGLATKAAEELTHKIAALISQLKAFDLRQEDIEEIKTSLTNIANIIIPTPEREDLKKNNLQLNITNNLFNYRKIAELNDILKK